MVEAEIVAIADARDAAEYALRSVSEIRRVDGRRCGEAAEVAIADLEDCEDGCC